MSNLRTTQDLIIEALQKAGEKTDGTSEYQATALDYMNQFYRDILAGGSVFEISISEPWAWAKARYPLIMTLEPAYDSGSVALTEDSAVGVFSAAPAISLAGRILKLDNLPDYMRIAAHDAGSTSFTLDSAYVGTTITGSAYAAHKLDYEVGTGELLRLFAPMRVHQPQSFQADATGTISMLDLRLFESKYPLKALELGTPTEFAETYNSNGISYVRFNKSVTKRTRVEVDYIPIPTVLEDAAASIPVIPETHRSILSLGTAHWILLDKEDDKAQTYFGLTKNRIQAMVSVQRRQLHDARRNFGRIIPRRDLVRGKQWDTLD